MGSLEATYFILLFRNSCRYPSIPLDIQGHLLRFGIWTPKRYLKHEASGGMTGCLGYLPQILLISIIPFPIVSIYHLYTTYCIVLAFWGVICHLPPFMGTRNNHWRGLYQLQRGVAEGGVPGGHSPSGIMAEIQPSTSCYGKYPQDLQTKLNLL